MAQEFLIDRQFGQAIWIDVENGIVQKCYNESPKYNARLDEMYKGKTISYFEKDFKERMKGTIHIFHPTAIISILHKIEGVKSRISNLNRWITSVKFNNGMMSNISPAEKKAAELKIKEFVKEQSGYKKELREAINEVESVHGYDCEVYKKAHLS